MRLKKIVGLYFKATASSHSNQVLAIIKQKSVYINWRSWSSTVVSAWTEILLKNLSKFRIEFTFFSLTQDNWYDAMWKKKQNKTKKLCSIIIRHVRNGHYSLPTQFHDVVHRESVQNYYCNILTLVYYTKPTSTGAYQLQRSLSWSKLNLPMRRSSCFFPVTQS